ncbi:Serine/threonine protein kinase [Gigaspora margarita]|uniref:Serine/threonine protein kinase n=1 Tax=Gigaspora margarita TaxID=4874 RepID=A0A8H4AHJ7_GIGMA|nr:Serine/threonine protein kinase [Gigaspora margarita]
MVNAQEYIENNFSKHSRVIDVAEKNLVGSLDLSEYSNLEELVILTNQITDLIFSEKNENITKIEAYNNHLINLNFLISLPNPEKLKWLGVYQNQITSNDLEVLAPFVNCEMLSIGKNNIHGHLSSLQYWTSLKRLDLVGIKPQVNGLDYIAHNPFSGVSGISGQFNQDYPPKTINEFNNNTWRGSNNFRKLSNDKVCEIINNLWQQSQQLKRQVESQSQELNKLKNEQSQEKKEQSQELDKLKNERSQEKKEQIQEFDKLKKEQIQELDKFKKEQSQELDKLKQQYQELDKLKKEQSQEFDKLKQQYQELDKLKKEQSQELDKLKQQSQELDKSKQQLQEFSNLFFPNQSYDFTRLKQEISHLKYQELSPQVRKKKEQLEQLVKKAKTKAGDPRNIVDKLLETQKEISKTKPESKERYRVEAQLTVYQDLLEYNLTKEELQNLLNEQIELFQLEEHLASLQINEVSNSQ